MEITSPHNPKIKEWAKLKQKKYREEQQRFLVEGFHLVEEAAAAGIIDCIVIREGHPHPFSQYPCYETTQAILDKLTSSVSGSPIVALCRYPKQPETICGRRVILLDRVQDPGNVGAIIRSAYAFGYDALVLSPGCADIYNEKVIRATQGALFHLPIIRQPLLQTIAQLKQQNSLVYATALHQDSIPLARLPRPQRFALLFGHEGQGVDPALLQASDASVYIEMEQFESLNVAIAAGICMYVLNHS